MSEAPKGLALRHVVLMHRHGDRSPITARVSPTLYMDEAERSYWTSQLPSPEVFAALDAAATVVSESEAKQGGAWPNGQLTQRGVDGMFARGQAIRAQYKDFLAGATPDDVYIVSTNITRTIRSAQSVVRGLFPEPAPFKVHTMAPQYLTPVHSNAEYMAFGIHANEVAQATRPGYATLEAQMKDILGLGADEDVHWTIVREVLVCRKAHGLPMPEGLTDELYAAACDQNAWEWHLLYSDPDKAQRGFVRGLLEIQTHLQSAVQTAISHRMTIISAHDNTIVALACALGLEMGHVVPDYGAILAFELYEDTATHESYVLVRFEGNAIKFAQQAQPLVPYKYVEGVLERFFATHATASAL
ncbi:histidine acid phosphatase [Achlya hypogyna]|uniref:Histidine acid phosphatase n=1 Tax=Achlya hypogyna TaxID=1202772 RepID=A0A1V9ZR92_ACHHY|nr:histidine acid phosphatase [Achlya hypogyna]